MFPFRSGLQRIWASVGGWVQNLWRQAASAIRSGSSRSGAWGKRGVVGTKPEQQLPPTALQTLALIRVGGPFPYPKDGSIFRNLEGSLPQAPKGYYKEYTVPPPPGSRTRGTQRLIVGDGGEVYYTADHYRTFWEVELANELP